jgi:hypothetical protein
MTRTLSLFAVALYLAAAPLAAQEAGSAGGRGTITRQTGWNAEKQEAVIEEVSFSPKYSYAYTEGKGASKFTWIVLTEKEPPLKSWAEAKDRAEARRLWCEKEKASFVAVKLDAEGEVDLYFLCPANGAVNTEMLSSWNGLESVVVKLETSDGKRLKGTLRGGEGFCSDDGGQETYCTPQEDYTFDAPAPR